MNYRKVPFMNGYNAMYPGEGFLSGAEPPAKPVKVMLRASTTLAPGWPGFMSWLATAHPQLFALVQVRYPNLALYTQNSDPAPVIQNMISGLGQSLTPVDVTATMLPTSTSASSGSTGFWAGLASSLTSIAPTVIATVDQQKIFNTQLSRAQQGLPPLNTSSYGLPSMSGAFSMLTMPVMLVVGGGLLFILSRRKKS